MTLKEMLDAALSECGFPPQPFYAGSQDPGSLQAFSIANRELRFVSKYPWQALRKEGQITLTDATDYALPSDWRQFITQSVWSNGLVRPVELPASDNVWGYLKSRAIDGLRYRAKIYGNRLHVNKPMPGDVIRFDYISKYPAKDSGGNALERFTADSDTFDLDDDLLIMGIKWRWKKEKGMDFQADYNEYNSYLNNLRGTDTSARTLNFGERRPGPPHAPQTELWL